MKCTRCQTENPPGAKFCNQCASKLELECPKCGNVNPPASKFCNECAHPLEEQKMAPAPKDLSFDQKIAKIQRYLPEGLTEKILSQRDRIEGERKQVTVMFCDMEGFTALTERLGPEEAYTIMDDVYEILIHKVHDYEGTVNEMTGDGIVALFGAPIALEDAPQRAIRSAMSIHREMIRFSERIGKERAGRPSLKMRIGIHSGPVVVGTLGNDLRVEFKAVGDTVNLASRMEKLARPGTTYVTEETFKLTEGLFRFEALGGKKIKGREEPANVYQVIAPSARRTRFDVSAERGLTPFVGRERELELLLDGFERAKAGRGQAFSIVAEAGLGKSRLLYEFRKAVTNEDVTFLEGRCLSYSRGVAYHPLIDMLKSNFDIRQAEGDTEITRKVKEGLRVMGTDEPSTLPYLLELFSVEDLGIDRIDMSTDAKKERILESLKGIILKGSEMRPLILAFEDLHWMDKGSEDALKAILESIPGSRVLLLFTYRPEFVHTWSAKSFHSQLNLVRLSNRESSAMVTHLLDTDTIESDLEELILEKTEGVPFFIEEFIKSLKDLKIIERKDNTYHLAEQIRQVAIPSTIQDVIMARVDTLSAGAKEVLQAGSAIEREFSYPLITKVTGLPEQELLKHLSALKDAEILFERGLYPDTHYVFRHALTQEVVYESILSMTKKSLHEEIAGAMEALYAENIEEHCGVLAEHCTMSENFDKAAHYSRLAGKKAEKTVSLNDAIAYTKKAIDCLERLPQTEASQERLIDARTVLGLYMFQLFHITEAKEAIEPIFELALNTNYQKRIAQIYNILAVYDYYVEEDFPKAFEHFNEVLQILEKTEDAVTGFFSSAFLGIAHMYCCEFDKVVHYYRKALDINVATNSMWGVAVMKGALGWTYGLEGRLDKGYQESNEALRLAEQCGDMYSLGCAHAYHAMCCHFKGHLKETKQHHQRALEFDERIDNRSGRFSNNFSLGSICLELGEYQKAKDHFQKAAWIGEQNHILPSFVGLNKIGFSLAKVLNNEKDIDLSSLSGYVAANKLKLYESLMRRYIGEIILNIDDQHLSVAKSWIEEAIETDRRNEMRWYLGRDYLTYAELYKREGDLGKARTHLNKAIGIFKECGADGWVEKAEKDLARC